MADKPDDPEKPPKPTPSQQPQKPAARYPSSVPPDLRYYYDLSNALKNPNLLSMSSALDSVTLSSVLGPSPRGEREQQLEQEISKLKAELDKQQKALKAEIAKGDDAKGTLGRLESTVKELQEKQRLNFVLNRIHEDAKQVFLESKEFQDEFLTNQQCEAYVMAVDHRRSTELMLKSRKAELFAGFIISLTNTLRQIVLDHHGVFDKFTGDGILAFFPDFYTGSDAGYYVMSAAQKCHAAFTDHYRKSLSSFYTVLSGKEVGLGIGIDQGAVNLVLVGEELAIVGTPVVYACRMAGTRAGNSLLNQPAYEKLNERFSRHCSLAEDEIEIKHEGVHIAYSVHLNEQEHVPADPAWRKFVKQPNP